MRILTLNILILLSTVISSRLGAQTLLPDSAILESSLNSVIKLYNQAVNENSRLYNGNEFIDPFERKLLNGHAYFISDEWQQGFIYYDHQLYMEASLKFDLFGNRLIVEHPISHEEIELISEKVGFFGLSDHLFVRLQTPTPGFYARLYDGTVKVYAMHYKTTQDDLTTKTKTTEFLSKHKYYIFKEGVYNLINSKGSALAVFKEEKDELKKMLSQENISFKKNKELALQRMGETYDQLKSSK